MYGGLSTKCMETGNLQGAQFIWNDDGGDHPEPMIESPEPIIESPEPMIESHSAASWLALRAGSKGTGSRWTRKCESQMQHLCALVFF